MGFFQYLQDTRGELAHVAWPTRSQTILYTVLVLALSVFVAIYLGFFDYIFTTILGRVVEVLPNAAPVFTPDASTTGEVIIATSTSTQ